MHIQIINFQLNGVTEAEFRTQCDGLAGAFAALPGLHSKVWLADPATGTYGGVYTWEDRAAMESYLASDLFKAVSGHPNLSGITSRDFGVIEGPTRVTRGLIGAPV
jgi:quinol monooxygenase YgiN